MSVVLSFYRSCVSCRRRFRTSCEDVSDKGLQYVSSQVSWSYALTLIHLVSLNVSSIQRPASISNKCFVEEFRQSRSDRPI
jgi:hypothetical protein